MNIRAEASQFHLLTLACFDCQRVCINPFIGGHLGRLRGIGEDVKDSWLIDDWQEGHTGHDLFEDGSDFCLNLFLGFGRNRIPGNESRNERYIQNNGTVCSLGVCSLLALSLGKVDIKNPPFERRTRILRDDSEDQLGDRSREQPFWDAPELFIIYHTEELSNTHSVSVSIFYVTVNRDGDWDRTGEHKLVKIRFERSVLSDQHSLTVFLNHLEVICRVYTALKEDPGSESVSDTSLVVGLDETYVLAAYLKNSVTSFVEPLRVMA